MNTQKKNDRAPRVSIGLPVYNGENYLAEAIESLLAQSYEDFELIITDNASTDRTREICESYAEKDSRVRYIRNSSNIGAAANYNLTFDLANGEYFKWAAHDDVCSVGFLKSSVKLLDESPSVVLCYPKEIAIDKDGNEIPEYMEKYHDLVCLNSSSPHQRFHDIACLRHPCFQVFGLMRSPVLGSTPRIANYIGSDRVLLAELSLKGVLGEIEQPIYFRRHSEQYCALETNDKRASWFNTGNNDEKSYTHSLNFVEYVRSIGRAHLHLIDRVRCYLVMLDWLRRKRHYLLRELLMSFK